MIKEFFSLLKRYMKPYRKYLTWAVILNFLSQWLNVFSFAALVPILNILFKIDTTKYEYMPMDIHHLNKDVLINNGYYFINYIIEQNGAFVTLIFMGLILIVMTLLKTTGYFASAAVMVPLRTGIVRDIRIEVYNKVLRLPLSFFSEERKGDIIARMSADVSVVENSLTSSLDMLIRNPIALVVCFITLFTVSWQLTLFVLVILPLAGWVMGSVSRKLKSQSVVAQGQWGDIMSQLDETLGGLRIIKAFIAERKMSERFAKINNGFRDAMNAMVIRQSSAHPMSEFLGTCVIVIVLWFGGALILNQYSPIDAAMFIFYLVILYSIINPLKEFSKAFYNIPLGLASMERIDMILKAENHIKEPERPLPLTDFEHELEFRDVSFSYIEGRQVLKHVNLKVQKGKTVALVGQSGSGKSTLVDLVPRYHDVGEGALLIDGKNVKDVSIPALRSLIGNVNQEAILFNDTFYNNITFGVENATMEQVIEAAKIANAHDFIMESEKGYDTMIGDRGGRLSGGQRQRVSIARAILKNPPILILDEATSALDTESERLVQEALERLMKSRTTIAIAHRLSTIKNADEICVLYEGEIVERGTHEELIALNGYYKKLNDMQSL
ncbi:MULTISPECIES: ABC transporter ATP-binding protein [Paraprevotella]|uniref:Lipid A export ATP-binding/permease protein MsbA n=2 Tax=Paraprevotella clara TaxID=454154 RepID=A0A6N3ESA2_9BACT|nr:MULTISPECIES: ABC transporter ATP-binding protein [Paraprevotella]EHH01152.1 putative lipid A export ATP-binding/permease protein MsbA [Paraprevotella clara YIT 11840]MBS4807071.1 ABC transporter ATP-binding protein [Paraprevotella sp.]MEE0572396.1 ABC transporter ATP-binding protein [Paraprevotella clara]RGU65026.1 ABC transporter ATP-binding protein [Paraprevotella clara]BDI73781.1 ABC transporter ATP-binding protein [Paraprevotella clara]